MSSIATGNTGSASGITFGGLASGIDTTSIISRLVALEQIPINRLQARQQEIQNKQGTYANLKSRMSAVAQAAGALNNPDAFNPVTGSSSTPLTATISTTSSATAGTYNLQVLKLAAAQKITSSAQSDTTSALGLPTGTFTLKGRAVDIDASDSLTTIARKVNSLGVGVTASLIDGGTGSAYLTLTSSSMGAANKISMGDLKGTPLESLGITSGAASVRESITNGATSTAFSSSSSPIGTQMAATGLGASSFSINGTVINADLSVNSLQDVANSINAASVGATASVRSVTTAGVTSYKLDIVGAAGTPTFNDPNNVLSGIGVLQQAPVKEIVAASDASYKLDGLLLSNSSNSISTAIPGATITLLMADATTPPSTTLSLNRDVGSIKSKVQNLVDAYNTLTGYIGQNSKFDSKTNLGGPLLGDSVSQQVQSSISNILFNNVPGTSQSYSNLTALGFQFDTSGILSFDDTKLTNAINSAPDDVSKLFRSFGTGSNSTISYVSSTSKTLASGVSNYSLNITQLATKATFDSGADSTGASTAAETLNFTGSMFGASPYSMTLDIGSTLASTVAKINSDSKLKDQVFASVNGNRIHIDSKRFGANGSFSVSSTMPPDGANSGIGTGGVSTAVAGKDVAGTINGEAVTGSGQFMTGNIGNKTTEGLQLQYTGTSTGIVGNMVYSKGVGSQLNELIGGYTDGQTGLMTITDTSLQKEIDGITTQMTDLNNRLAGYQQDLKVKFAAMESAISKFQQQSSQLAGLSTRVG